MTRLETALYYARALIAEPSVTPEAAGCFDLLEHWLQPLGFTVYRRIFEAANAPPTENFYAVRSGEGPNLCFAGHVDVVPPGDLAAWTSPPFSAEIRGGRLYGRGAEDMKGAIGAMIAAIARYLASAAAPITLSLLLTADEEGPAVNGTVKALDWIAGELQQTLDYCLVGEPTNPTFLGEMAKLGRRGSLLAKLTVLGQQGHVAYPHLADNPITRLVAALHALKTRPLDGPTEFFPASNLEITTIDVGNPVHNLIPGKACAEFNIRFNDAQTGASLERWIHQICAESAGAHSLEFHLSGESFLTSPGPLSDALLAAAERVTGHRPELSTTGGTSDARFIHHYCPVIEFGTTGRTPHRIDECVEVAVLEQLAEVYTAFIAEIAVRHSAG